MFRIPTCGEGNGWDKRVENRCFRHQIYQGGYQACLSPGYGIHSASIVTSMQESEVSGLQLCMTLRSLVCRKMLAVATEMS